MIHDVLKQFEVDLHVVELLPSDREATAALLHANGYVDLIIRAAAATSLTLSVRMPPSR